jgi:hypothetical protein
VSREQTKGTKGKYKEAEALHCLENFDDDLEENIMSIACETYGREQRVFFGKE